MQIYNIRVDKRYTNNNNHNFTIENITIFYNNCLYKYLDIL